MQVQAIGTTVASSDFPPAKIMLGNWTVYQPADIVPPLDYIAAKRKK
jgi:branched-chain amino acid transport system substrate-binding protein